MRTAICFSILDVRRSAMAACAMLTFAAPVAQAQMQIPNPLIRPRSVMNQPDADGARVERPNRAAAPAMPAAPVGFGPAAAVEDPYTRSVAELKERFAGFYVSAIVGKQAMLRRSAAIRASALSQPAQPTGTSMAPLPLGSVPASAASRNDAFMLADGELVASVGTTGAVVARVTSSEVTIYHVQEVMALPGGKLGGIRTVVFSGAVESGGGNGVPAIVLERPDPAYKRMITVETRSRTASSGQQEPAGTNTGGGSSSNATAPTAGMSQ